jgi:hypothetical protein
MKLVYNVVGILTSRGMQYVYLLQVLDEKRFVRKLRFRDRWGRSGFARPQLHARSGKECATGGSEVRGTNLKEPSTEGAKPSERAKVSLRDREEKRDQTTMEHGSPTSQVPLRGTQPPHNRRHREHLSDGTCIAVW